MVAGDALHDEGAGLFVKGKDLWAADRLKFDCRVCAGQLLFALEWKFEDEGAVCEDSGAVPGREFLGGVEVVGFGEGLDLGREH